MYEFQQPEERNMQELDIPSEALYLDGLSVEERLKGYRTLGVSGRELMPQDLITEDNVGNGSLFIGSRYPARLITVYYSLQAESNQLFREMFEKLNRFLIGNQKELRFADDYSHSFYGTLSEVDDIPKGTNNVISSFSFYCSDPFKYKNAIKASGNKTVSLTFDDFYPTLPSLITVTPSVQLSTITIKSGEKQIKLVEGSFALGKAIVFDIKEQTIISGITDLKDKLDLASEFEDFYIKSGQPITLTENGEIEVSVRQVAL